MTTVLIFLKAPQLGQVKTRLAAAIGPEAALALYRGWGAQALAAVPAEWEVEVCYTPDEAAGEMRHWLGPRPQLRPQGPGDLGARLRAAAAAVLARRPGPVLVIGGDCPGLGVTELRAAESALVRADLVLGPARDGGYYLIGFNRLVPELLVNMPWSTARVLAETRRRAAAHGLSVALLPEKEDIDDVEALRRHERGKRGADYT